MSLKNFCGFLKHSEGNNLPEKKFLCVEHAMKNCHQNTEGDQDVQRKLFVQTISSAQKAVPIGRKTVTTSKDLQTHKLNEELRPVKN